MKPHTRLWIRRLGAGIAILLALLLVLPPLAGGFLIKHAINTAGPALLGVPIHLEGATLNPIAGRLALKGLRLGNPEGFKSTSLFDMALLDVRLRVRSLLGRTIIIDSIVISGPELTYERGLKTSNIDHLLKQLAPAGQDTGAKPAAKAAKPSRKVVIRELAVNGTRVHVAWSALGGKGLTLPLPPVRLANIGGQDDGVTPGEAVREILAAILKSAKDVVAGSGKALGEGATKAGDAITEGAGKAVDSLKGLLPK